MPYRWIRKPAWLGLGLAAILAAAASGCGNQTADKDNAIVIPPPDANLPSRSTSTGTSSTATPSSGGGGTTTAAPSTSAAASVKAEGWGTLKGKVIFGGTPPPQAVLQEVGKAAKDPNICAKDQPILSERLVVNSGTKGVKNVFVYLQRPTAVNDEAKKAAASKPVDFDQKNCTFTPHALAVMTGTPVNMKSSDATSHNVNFQLKALNSNQTMQGGSTMTVTPDTAERGPGPVSCSIHPWMIAYWMVLEHPYFAVTDENGNFEIKNVPAGTQKVVAWQEAVGYVTAGSGDAVNIKPNDTTTQDFTIDPAKVKPGV